MRLILASGSPRRRELLARLDVSYEVIGPAVQERNPVAGENPVSFALELAQQKAAAVADQHADAVVLGADTVVATDQAILGKPRDREDALRMLRLLRGRRHQVVTAVVVRQGTEQHSGAVVSYVDMKPIGDEGLMRYIETGEPDDKAGAYAVQGLGAALVRRVEGCYNNVVGLPLCLTVDLLTRFGVDVKGSDEPSHPSFQPDY